MQPVPDPYRLLGVARAASATQIKAAHRALAKRYHPDAPGGDTVRFLQVQAAYDLLSDPLRRREWDARHASGPMRAGQPAASRPRAANGRWTRADDAGGQRPSGAGQAARRPPADRDRPPATGRDPSVRSYTWSASEVPWWEDRAPREGSRRPGRQRPSEPDRPPADEATHDFDVYNRSSGAAWSSAARAYFRRGESELPRRGSFHRQGTQPLTAARARAAAEEEARRSRPAAPPGGARPEQRRPAASASPGSDPGAPPPGGQGRPARPAAQPAQPAYAWAGVARDAQAISQVRSSARQAAAHSTWPTLTERLAYALLAWLPLAILIGYAGSIVTGCDRAAVSCPPQLETVQSLLIALSLGLFVLLPRLAYVAAFATAGLIVAAMAVVLGAWFAGIRPPLAAPGLAIVGVLLAIVYLATASWALADGPRRRPWAAQPRARFGSSR